MVAVPKTPKKLIGEVLQEAGLISPQQVNFALAIQKKSLTLKIGEILASKGWLKQETVDFFVHFFLEDKLITYNHYQPIGYYFKKAGLLDEEQINIILKEQKKLGIKFCYLAVLKGFLTEKTVEFFLENIAQKSSKLPINEQQYAPVSTTQTVIGDHNPYELIKEQETIIKDNIPNYYSEIKDEEIEFSPIWIDI